MSRSATPMHFVRYVSQVSSMDSGASVSAQHDQWIGSVSARTPSKSNKTESYAVVNWSARESQHFVECAPAGRPQSGRDSIIRVVALKHASQSIGKPDGVRHLVKGVLQVAKLGLRRDEYHVEQPL